MNRGSEALVNSSIEARRAWGGLSSPRLGLSVVLPGILGPLAHAGMRCTFGAQEAHFPAASDDYVEFNMIHMQGRDGLVDALPELSESTSITAQRKAIPSSPWRRIV
jgi:hypothetical protein